MPVNTFKKAVSVGLITSIITNSMPTEATGDLIPANINLSTPNFSQTLVEKSNFSNQFSLKSVETSISKIFAKKEHFKPQRKLNQIYEGTCGDNVTYSFDDETGILTISGTGPMEDYNPLATFPTYAPWTANAGKIKEVVIQEGVTKIGTYAFFSGCKNVTSVTIPEGITHINDYAFFSCENLSGEMKLPASLEYIGKNTLCTNNLTAFNVSKENSHFSSVDGILFSKDQTKLILFPAGKQGEYIMPDTVTDIESMSFSYCKKLTSLTISNGVKDIKDSTFYVCTGLISLIIPDSVETIGYKAFYGCESLNSIKFGKSINSIGYNAFDNCYTASDLPLNIEINNDYMLSNFIVIDRGTKEINLTVNNVATISKISKSGIISLVLSESVKKIDKYACSYYDLKNVTVLGNLDYIGGGAFWNNEDLESFIYKGTTVPGYDSSFILPFDGCKKLTAVNVPYNYRGTKFCGKPVIKDDSPETSEPIDPEAPDTTESVDPGSSESSGNGSNKTVVIASTVSTAVVVAIAAVLGGILFYRKYRPIEDSTLDISISKNNAL